jgi:hypothetical protein
VGVFVGVAATVVGGVFSALFHSSGVHDDPGLIAEQTLAAPATRRKDGSHKTQSQNDTKQKQHRKIATRPRICSTSVRRPCSARNLCATPLNALRFLYCTPPLR